MQTAQKTEAAQNTEGAQKTEAAQDTGSVPERAHGARVLAASEGQAYWFLGSKVIVKASGEQTRNRLTVLDFVNPPGFAPPVHRHLVEDECFYVISGWATFVVDGQRLPAGPGDFVYLPVGSTHTFIVGDDAPLHTLQITVPAGFEEFTAEAGEPVTGDTPPDTPLDPVALTAAAARHQIEILGPPPVH
ncbi:cupin domain-containing protein [Sinomonas sp. ASV486]|uniref:cupin domain-containing protein n=1 Tax=Sinomonas sp. ASV486 TaxID=3051170 RepID=UPI0027DE21A1|nr:cupin domain-containing protein [Sinomonas sp. ASV486]MDQ4489611.1 cupin domain-containing protein [Sinomonas sp. ASV486]